MYRACPPRPRSSSSFDPARAAASSVDLAGSTPVDPLVRLYRRVETIATLVFLGCASPVWNAQLSLTVEASQATRCSPRSARPKSHDGRLVARIELLGRPERLRRPPSRSSAVG